MFYDNGVLRKRHPLGKISGIKGGKLHRYINGEQYTSRLAENYRSPDKRQHLEKLRNFGEAGVIARHINNNPVLKSIWAESFNKPVYTVYNEVSRTFIKQFNRGVEALPAEEQLRELLRRKRQMKLELVPDPDEWAAGNKLKKEFTEEELKRLKQIFKGSCENTQIAEGGKKIISFNGGNIELNGYNDCENVTGLITFTGPKGKRDTLRITGSKCGARNKELEEKEQVREEKKKLKYLRSMLKAADKYRLEYEKRKQQRKEQIHEWRISGGDASYCPSVCGGIIYRFDEEVDIRTEAGMQSFAFDLFEAKRIRKLFTDIKQNFGFELIPNEEECECAAAALDICDMENKVWGAELHERKKERIKNEKKYLRYIFGGVTPVFARRTDGSFYLVNADEVKAAASKFRNYNLYLVLYNKDWEGFAETYFTETVSGKTKTRDEKEEIVYPLLILILFYIYIRKTGYVQRE